MSDFTVLVTLLATLSVAVERAVEIFKGFIPYLNNPLPPGSAENRRRAIMNVVAVAFGTIAAYSAKGQIQAIPAAKWLVSPDLHDTGYLIIGFLTAGGSAFWNHVLDILSAFKTQKEKVANALAPLTAPAPAAPPAPAAAAAAAAGPAPAGKP